MTTVDTKAETLDTESEVEEVEEKETSLDEVSVPDLSPEEIEIKRLGCLNTRLRIGMIQVGMESLQKDLQQMHRELMEQRAKYEPLYEELKLVMECPEDHEVDLETGNFVPRNPPQQ